MAEVPARSACVTGLHGPPCGGRAATPVQSGYFVLAIALQAEPCCGKGAPGVRLENKLALAGAEGGRPSETPGDLATPLSTNAVALTHLMSGTCVEDTPIARRRKWLGAELMLEQASGLPPSKLAHLTRRRHVKPKVAAAFSEMGAQVCLL